VIQGGVLTLDLASIVGWAYGHKGERPSSGTWILRGHQLGPRFVGFENELIRAIETYRPRLIVMEAPLPPTRQASTFVARQQFGLAAYVEGEGCRAGIDVREMPFDTVRKAVLGRGRFGGTDQAKAAVLAWCRAQGWNPSDHNAADAIVLWAFATGIRCAPELAL
jgi:Holliday junction resolvasome RuvABC endonuclease subunit